MRPRGTGRLLTMQELLRSLKPGLLGPHIAPLLPRLRMLPDQDGIPGGIGRKAHPSSSGQRPSLRIPVFRSSR